MLARDYKEYCEWFDLVAWYWTDWTQLEKLDILEGRVSIDDATQEAQEAAMPEFLAGAKEILSIPTKKQRQEALATLPVLVRATIEQEVMKIWEKERSKHS